MNYVCIVIRAYENLTKEELIKELLNAKTSHDSLQTSHDSLQKELSKIRFQLDQLLRAIHGSKSERFIANENPAQLSLLDVAPKSQEEKPGVKIAEHERRKKENKKPSRNLLPDHLERITRTIYPEGFDENSTAPRIGEEVTEELDYIPGKMVVNRTVRPKFKDVDGNIVIAELRSRLIEKGLFGTALIVRILIDKYVDHLPLYRQCERFKRAGVEIASSTVGDVPRQVADKMELLYMELVRQVLLSAYLNADETPTPVLDSQKKGKTHRGYHWVYYSPHEKLVLFDYRPGRGREGPEEMLKNFKGFLQTDGYSVYDAFENRDGITLVGCMAHARRYFEQALQSDHDRATYMMQKIQLLYDVEREIKDSHADEAQIVKLRQEKSLSVLNEIHSWLKENIIIVTPSSPPGKAMAYMLSRWEKLSVYVHHAHLNIDNNLVENAIRPSVIGRKNYLFSGSHEGAARSAMFYSFFGSCKMNGINPEEWLADVIEKLPETKSSQLYTLLPNHWKKA